MKKAVLGMFLMLLVSACSPSTDVTLEKTKDNFGVEVTVNKKGDMYTISPRKIHQVLPLRGHMPVLNNPEFVDVSAADGFLKADDLVMGLKVGTAVRAYPVKIMRWHPVVNDSMEAVPVFIAYDPISDMGVAYKRIVKMPGKDEEITLNTSDKMYNSNPLVKDAETKTTWSPHLGEAIFGRLAGRRLEELPLVVTSWDGWKKAYPSTQVLSIDTGHRRDYDKNIYEDYYRGQHLLFEVEHEDRRLPNKEYVFGVHAGGEAKAYPVKLLSKGTSFKDSIGEIDVTVSMDEFGIFSVVPEKDVKVSIRRLLWFAWIAFNPDTALYEAAKN